MNFDLCAQTYDAHARPQKLFAAKFADFIGSGIPADKPVLEFGAGTGALTWHLCNAGAAVHATDASEAMVRVGSQRVPTARWSKLDAFSEKPPEALVQTSSGLLHWAEDPLAVLTRWKAALLPGGRMFHAFPCEPCLTEWREVVPENPVTWRDERGWTELFAKAGLRVLRRQVWVETCFHVSALEMLRAMHMTGVTGRPTVGTGRLRRALRLYDELHARAQGVAATWAWLAVEAAGE